MKGKQGGDDLFDRLTVSIHYVIIFTQEESAWCMREQCSTILLRLLVSLGKTGLFKIENL